DHPAARMVEPCCKRRGLAEVAAEPDHPQVRIERLQPGKDLVALIRTPVVHNDDFILAAPGAEGRGQLAMELFERLGLVVDRNDHAQFRTHRLHAHDTLPALRLSALLQTRYATNPATSSPAATSDTSTLFSCI